MPVKYDLYESPSDQGYDSAPLLHARVVTDGTVETAELAKEIEQSCTVTKADVYAVLSALSDAFVQKMREGRCVHIEGLGFFQMTLNCPPVHSSKEVRAEAIRFKSISFRPEKKLKEQFATVRFVRSEVKRHSNDYSNAEIDALLTAYFSNHRSILRSEFEQLCGFTKSTATRRLNSLLCEGKLKKQGLPRFPMYEPAEGHYKG